ncbi:hypothetical protein [Streptomyces sp. NPDC051561]|uniref:hypothetical protein n=1 Tax=Streptomyces sp. NPDC051561 TaxID=3365658 RepID=UPI0037A2C7BE
MTRTFHQLLSLLHEEGLTWLTVDDVINNLGAVARWGMHREVPAKTFRHSAESGPLGTVGSSGEQDRFRLQELCAQAGWPLPLEGGGRDHTTPAALAVFEAKSRLAKAMVADSVEQKISANTIAGRAQNAQSRPTTLKILSAELLLHDTAQALEPLFQSEALFVTWGQDRAVQLMAVWEDEPRDERLSLLADAKSRLDAASLHLADEKTGESVDITRLAADDAQGVVVRRLP